MDRVENDGSNSWVCIRCRGNIFTEPLPSNGREYKRFMGGIYEAAVVMGSGAMIYIPRFIKSDSGIQKSTGGIHRQHGNRISLFSFFQNKWRRLINCKLKIYLFVISLIENNICGQNTSPLFCSTFVLLSCQQLLTIPCLVCYIEGKSVLVWCLRWARVC
jgi:hypothetical protein